MACVMPLLEVPWKRRVVLKRAASSNGTNPGSKDSFVDVRNAWITYPSDRADVGSLRSLPGPGGNGGEASAACPPPDSVGASDRNPAVRPYGRGALGKASWTPLRGERYTRRVPYDDDSADLDTNELGERVFDSIDECNAAIGQLRKALESRDIIGQAKGILMTRQRISAEEAFDILRRASQRSHMKLRDVAASVVATLGEPYEEPPPNPPA